MFIRFCFVPPATPQTPVVLVRYHSIFVSWKKKVGKGFYNDLWKFNFMGRFIGLIFRQRHFPFPKHRARPVGGKNRERVSCSFRRGRLSVHAENGADEFVFQTAFHVLVQAGVGTAAFVIDRPATQLVYVALIVRIAIRFYDTKTVRKKAEK